MTKRMLVGMVLAAIAVGFAWGQDAGERVLLRYKWNVGEEVTWAISAEGGGEQVNSDLTKEPPTENAMNIFLDMEMPMHQTVEAVDEEGNGTVAYQMGVMQVNVQAGDQPIHHTIIDPAAQKMIVEGEEMPLPAPLLTVLGEPMRMVVSPRGEVLSSQVPIDLELFFGMTQVSPAQGFQTMPATQMVLPEQPIGIGYTWAKTTDIKLGTASQDTEAGDDEAEAQPAEQPEAVPPEAPEAPSGMTLTMLYTLADFETIEGVECARIEVVGVLDAAEPFTISPSVPGADLNVDLGPMHISMRGVIYFDPEASCEVRSEMHTIMQMRQETRGEVKHGDETHPIHMVTTSDNFEMDTITTREGEG